MILFAMKIKKKLKILKLIKIKMKAMIIHKQFKSHKNKNQSRKIQTIKKKSRMTKKKVKKSTIINKNLI